MDSYQSGSCDSAVQNIARSRGLLGGTSPRIQNRHPSQLTRSAQSVGAAHAAIPDRADRSEMMPVDGLGGNTRAMIGHQRHRFRAWLAHAWLAGPLRPPSESDRCSTPRVAHRTALGNQTLTRRLARCSPSWIPLLDSLAPDRRQLLGDRQRRLNLSINRPSKQGRPGMPP